MQHLKTAVISAKPDVEGCPDQALACGFGSVPRVSVAIPTLLTSAARNITMSPGHDMLCLRALFRKMLTHGYESQ